MYHQWQDNLRLLDIQEIKTVPFVPTPHPFIERLIGSVRREFLDHVCFWNAADLQRKLDRFQAYYNTERVHASLHGRSPEEMHKGFDATLSNYRWQRCCHGLYEVPMAA